MTSLSTQSTAELGGSHSILARQKREHVELDRLLQAIDTADGAARQELLTRLCRLVFPHAFAEESVLWPLARKVLSDGEALTLQIEQEHQEINELFTELERTPPDDARHRQLWARIAELLRQDVRDEEDDLLPKLQQALSHRQLIATGWAWEAVRRTAPTRPHPVVARRPPGNVAAAAPLTVIDRLRDRLDQLSRRTSGTPASAAVAVSGGLAKVAGVLEHVPPLTRGERPDTHTSR
ncbi:hemerythrin domain-containing protein [Mycobacterium sp. SMC-4]|uniref:hemerythrin domain-containing protein n=1 Tax=Mycobacterium sp. SMC-4 TaxID=2857059 RepID=UPI003D0247E7